jgi:AraC-like DNA-binding protein
MKQSCSTPPAPFPGAGIQLQAVWHVHADASYDVRRPRPAPPSLIAVRTCSGHGRLRLWNGPEFDLPPGSLLITENERIAHYHRVRGTWHFWWFEFQVSGRPVFPLNQRMAVPAAPGDPRELERIFRGLRSPQPLRRSLASAVFQVLLTRWLCDSPDTPNAHPRQAHIDRSVEAMHRNVADNWPVTEMAREARMSERAFRSLFQSVMGESPKRFYDRLRVETGAAILRQGLFTVSQVADHLGFSSPFHFSKVFHHHLGVRPSHLRKPRA